MAQYLTSTQYLNFEHPSIAELVANLKMEDPVASAVNIHDFVRDEIRFGWSSRFYAMTASEVLEQGVGYCNTKATLFIALLRGAGIPSRQRFVTINSNILEPFIDLPQSYVDHSFTEVYLNGKWHSVDSYIPDPALFFAAQSKLKQEGTVMGYGVHINGVNSWSGDGDSFAQFVLSDSLISSTDYGLFADTQAFYAKDRRSESLVGIYRFLIPLGIRKADRAVVRFVGQTSQKSVL